MKWDEKSCVIQLCLHLRFIYERPKLYPRMQVIRATLMWLGLIVAVLPSGRISFSSRFSVTNSASIATNSPFLGISSTVNGSKVRSWRLFSHAFLLNISCVDEERKHVLRALYAISTHHTLCRLSSVHIREWMDCLVAVRLVSPCSADRSSPTKSRTKRTAFSSPM